MIAAEKAQDGVAISRACELLNVLTSGYCEWARRPPSDRALGDARLTEKITEIHHAIRRVYGAPCIIAELRMTYGVRVCRKRGRIQLVVATLDEGGL